MSDAKKSLMVLSWILVALSCLGVGLVAGRIRNDQQYVHTCNALKGVVLRHEGKRYCIPKKDLADLLEPHDEH